MSFDNLDSDLWTSLVLNIACHHYYVLFLDDHTNFLWTFLISKKSQVFEIFNSLANLIKTQFFTNINVFNVIMDMNMTTNHFADIVMLMVLFFASLALALLLKTVKQNEKSTPLTT